MADEIPLFEIDWDRSEIMNVIDSITRGGYWAKGPYVTEFETALEEYLDVKHALTFSSGTTALEGALRAADIGEGDEVVVPSFTFIATANAVRLAGAEPVFADIERETFGIDPDAVRTATSEDTAAILPIHCYGRPCRISALKDIAEDRDLLLIEDAAESFGASVAGEKVGTVGDVGCLSFCQNKVISTGEGGAVVTDDDDLAENLDLVRSHGRSSGQYFDGADSGNYVELGSNHRMSDLTASVGLAQLDRVEDLIDRRRAVAERYGEELADLEGVERPVEGSEQRHVYQIYTVLFEDKAHRRATIDALASDDIASKIYWDPPVHETSYYRSNTASTGSSLEVTRDVASRVLSLPMHPNLSDEEVDRIVHRIKQVSVERR